MPSPPDLEAQRAAAVKVCLDALVRADQWEWPGSPGAAVAESVLRALRAPYTRSIRQHNGPNKRTSWRPR